LIAGCNKYVAAFLQIVKETGARSREIFTLKWIGVDLKTRTLRITAEKGSNARIFKISSRMSKIAFLSIVLQKIMLQNLLQYSKRCTVRFYLISIGLFSPFFRQKKPKAFHNKNMISS